MAAEPAPTVVSLRPSEEDNDMDPILNVPVTPKDGTPLEPGFSEEPDSIGDTAGKDDGDEVKGVAGPGVGGAELEVHEQDKREEEWPSLGSTSGRSDLAGRNPGCGGSQSTREAVVLWGRGNRRGPSRASHHAMDHDREPALPKPVAPPRVSAPKDRPNSGSKFRIQQIQVGPLIGKGGQTLQSIIKQTGAIIDIDQSTKEKGYSTVHIQPGHGASAAKELIDAQIRRTDPTNRAKDHQEMRIEQSIVGTLIGRGGEAINLIKDQSGADVVFDQQTSRRGFSTLHITGTFSAVAKAKTLVEEMLVAMGYMSGGQSHQDAHASKASDEMRIRQEFVGAVIGAGGETLRSIQRDTGTYLIMNQSTKEHGYSMLRIVAEDDQAIAAAKEAIASTIASVGGTVGPADGSVVCKVPQEHAGLVLGRGASLLRHVQDETGASVEVDQSTKDKGYTLVRIHAGHGALQAQELIVAKIREAEALAAYSEEELRVEQHLVGLLIGRGGAALQELQAQCDAAVSLDQSTSWLGFSTVRIAGSQKAVAEARDLVHDRMGNAKSRDAERRAARRSASRGRQQQDTEGRARRGPRSRDAERRREGSGTPGRCQANADIAETMTGFPARRYSEERPSSVDDQGCDSALQNDGNTEHAEVLAQGAIVTPCGSKVAPLQEDRMEAGDADVIVDAESVWRANLSRLADAWDDEGDEVPSSHGESRPDEPGPLLSAAEMPQSERAQEPGSSSAEDLWDPIPVAEGVPTSRRPSTVDEQSEQPLALTSYPSRDDNPSAGNRDCLPALNSQPEIATRAPSAAHSEPEGATYLVEASSEAKTSDSAQAATSEVHAVSQAGLPSVDCKLAATLQDNEGGEAEKSGAPVDTLLAHVTITEVASPTSQSRIEAALSPGLHRAEEPTLTAAVPDAVPTFGPQAEGGVVNEEPSGTRVKIVDDDAAAFAIGDDSLESVAQRGLEVGSISGGDEAAGGQSSQAEAGIDQLAAESSGSYWAGSRDGTYGPVWSMQWSAGPWTGWWYGYGIGGQWSEESWAGAAGGWWGGRRERRRAVGRHAACDRSGSRGTLPGANAATASPQSSVEPLRPATLGAGGPRSSSIRSNSPWTARDVSWDNGRRGSSVRSSSGGSSLGHRLGRPRHQSWQQGRWDREPGASFPQQGRCETSASVAPTETWKGSNWWSASGEASSRGTYASTNVAGRARYRGRSPRDRASWSPTRPSGMHLPHSRNLKIVLNHLLGKWHGMATDGALQCYEVAIQLMPSRSNGAQLSCRTVADCTPVQAERPVRFEGGDILLGERNRLFLDAIRESQVTWADERDPETRYHWMRGWPSDTVAPGDHMGGRASLSPQRASSAGKGRPRSSSRAPLTHVPEEEDANMDLGCPMEAENDFPALPRKAGTQESGRGRSRGPTSWATQLAMQCQ